MSFFRRLVGQSDEKSEKANKNIIPKAKPIDKEIEVVGETMLSFMSGRTIYPGDFDDIKPIMPQSDIEIEVVEDNRPRPKVADEESE